MTGTNENELVLIDLSSIAYPLWHISQSEPDPNHTSTQIVARVRAIATNRPHAAVCCDMGRSFRRDQVSTYKANRPEHDAALQHQINLARTQLLADGFPVWGVKGFEADDVIATAVTQILATPELTALVVSADKDLLQLIGPRVRQMKPADGTIFDAEAVVTKLGVKPEQMRDYLTLVGDTSDNIKGVPGIGAKKAAAILNKFGALDAVYADLKAGKSTGLPPSVIQALRDFEPHLQETRMLVTLRTDVEIPFLDITNPRQPKDVESFDGFIGDDPDPFVAPEPAAVAAPVAVPAPPEPERARAPEPVAGPVPVPTPAPQTGMALRSDEPSVSVAPPDWERSLDPRSMRDAQLLSKHMYDSRMFSAYGSPQAVLATIMVGRELGLPAMASLRNVHNIEGRHALSAALMVALVLKSGLAEYFDPVEFDEVHATFVTKRRGGRKEIALTHTIEMAKTAGLIKEKSNWLKIPTEMLMARAQSRLARLVYPDLLAGLYTPDELEDARLAAQAA
jgi:5'-3' exonuclease